MRPTFEDRNFWPTLFGYGQSEEIFLFGHRERSDGEGKREGKKGRKQISIAYRKQFQEKKHQCRKEEKLNEDRLRIGGFKKKKMVCFPIFN